MQHGLFRNLASRLTKLTLRSSMGVKNAPDVSAFRAFRRDIRDAFADFGGSYVSLDVLLTWGTTNFGSVTVAHDERRYGRSNYTLRKLIVHAINMTTGFSTLPLRLASLVGFAFTLFGIAVLVYVLGRFALSGLHSIPGFPFLASIIAIFAGAQLFALGIIGEYLARVYTRTIERPTYAIKQSTERPGEEQAALSG
jgi:undecaprenyl-phosphate 4-deoxy-4-formamido-L-arabinose transferase